MEDGFMKKTYYYILGIMLAAGFAFSACTSEDDFAVENAKLAKAFTVSIPATYVDAETRAVELTDDGTYLKAYFKEGDQIRVFRTDNDLYVWNQNDLVTVSSTGTTTTLEGTLTNQYKVGEEILLAYGNTENQYMSFPFFSYGVQDGTFKSASKWDFAYAKVKVKSVDKEAGTMVTEAANFKSSQSYFILSFIDKANNSPVKAKNVTIESSKILPSFVGPQKNSDEYRFGNYRIFLETPSSDVWVVMTIFEGATEDEEISFIVEDEDGKIYKGTKTASVGDSEGQIKNGKFYSSTIELEPTEIVNTLKIESDKYELNGITYRIKADAKVSGKSYLTNNIMAYADDITITLDNVDITMNGSSFSTYNDNVTVNLVGTNYMTTINESYGAFSVSPSTSFTFTGTGTLVLNNSKFMPEDNLKVMFKDGLVAIYDPVTNTTTIAPAKENDAIFFEDENVKDACVAKWDTNSDGLISYAEAAAVTDLGTAFKGNTAIKHFTELRFFTGLTSISESAFEDCTALESIILPNVNLSSISAKAFKGVTSMEKIIFPESLTTIGEGAFEGCTALKGNTDYTFRIPVSVSEIGANAFKGCSSLVCLDIYSKNLTIGTSAFENTLLKDNGVGFNYNDNGEVHFGERAFYGSELSKISVGNATIVTFDKEVFLNCKLYYIEMRKVATPPTFGTDMLKGCENLVNIYVPSANIEAYQTADGWETYKDIISGV